MYNIVVLDCDLISSFAKINRIDLLETLFSDSTGDHGVCIQRIVENERTWI